MKVKARLPRKRNKTEFHRHRYPEVSLEEMRDRMLRFQRVLGDSRELQVKKLSKQFYQISR
jgi:5-bromo-4-chloroindolyl phosphate hydrolysis protein